MQISKEHKQFRYWWNNNILQDCFQLIQILCCLKIGSIKNFDENKSVSFLIKDN